MDNDKVFWMIAVAVGSIIWTAVGVAYVLCRPLTMRGNK